MSSRHQPHLGRVLNANFVVVPEPPPRQEHVYARDVLIAAEHGFNAFHGRSPKSGEIEASSAGVIGWAVYNAGVLKANI